MDFQHSSLRLDESSRSDIETTPAFQIFQTKTTLFEDLLYSLSQPYARTDVALLFSHGPIIRLHKWVLCYASATMKQRIENAENSSTSDLGAGYLILKLPEHLHLEATMRVVFLMYLGQTIYSNGASMKDALSWFGIKRVTKTSFEDQEFFEDYESEKMRIFQRYSVRYAMDGVDFYMDIKGKSTRFPLSSNPTPIRLFCMECGMIFNSNEELETHHVNSACPEDARLKLVDRKNPALCCIDCGDLYVRLIKQGNSGISNNRISGASTILRSKLPTYFESFTEGLCHRCSPAPQAPSAEVNSTRIPYSPTYCYKCLQVFYSAEEEQDHEEGCATALEIGRTGCLSAVLETDEDVENQDGEAAIVLGKGPLGNHRVDTCKIDDCGMVFVEAPSLNEGIYQHSDHIHNIRPHKAFGIHLETLTPTCLVCGTRKGNVGHCLDTVGDFLKNVYDCFQRKKTKMRRNPPLAMKLVPEHSIARDLDSSRWYQRLDIHTNNRSYGQNIRRNSLRNPGPSEKVPQVVESVTGRDPVNRKCKVAENETGAKTAATKKTAGKKLTSKKAVSTKPVAGPVSTEAAVAPLSTGPVALPGSAKTISGPVSAEPVAGEKKGNVKKKKMPASSATTKSTAAKSKSNPPTKP